MTELPRTSEAVVQTAVRSLELRDIPLPAIDADSALLRVEACGICGSDYEQYEGKLPTAPVPVVPGHEPLGTIAAIGDDAARRWNVDVGDRVAVEPLLTCRDCSYCRSGLYTRCPELTLYSFVPLDVPPGLWGGYAQYMYLDRRAILHPIRSDIPPELAVMFNPLAAGYRWSVEIPGTGLGDDVLVMGPGQRGLASVIACRQAGAGTVAVTGLEADAAKLDLATLYGADLVVDVQNEDLAERVLDLTGGKGADVIVDTTPYATQPILDAIEVAAAGATLVLAGVKGHRPVDGLMSDAIIRKEMTIKGARSVTSSGYRHAIRAIESGEVPLDAMHTHSFDLADAELAIRTLAREVPGEESIHSCLIPAH